MSIVTLEKEENKEKNFLSKMAEKKPKKSSHELVQKMKSKGITLAPYTEKEVETYLLNNNNFLRLCSYRKNYQKYLNGKNVGKYINLSFVQLRALAILDMKLRKLILCMCIDIEHSLKLKILKDFETSDDDGYTLVQNFFKSDTHGQEVATNILKKHNNVYIRNLEHKYIYLKDNDDVFTATPNDCNTNEYNLDIPIWAMMEMIAFGDLLHFYNFYYDKNRFEYPRIPIPYKVLLSVKNIRNACAHNNCILNNLSDKSSKIKPQIRNFVSDLGLSTNSPKLKCKALYEMICVLFSLKELSSYNVMKHNINELKSTLDDFSQKNLEIFNKNELILSTINFLKKIIDKLYIS